MDDKKSFVENELRNVLMKADSNIVDISYINSDFLQAEFVHILYKNGTYTHINITGDSEINIMYDVAKILLTS